MSEEQSKKRLANTDAEKLDQGSPADAEQDERKPTKSGTEAASSIPTTPATPRRSPRPTEGA